MPEKIKKRILVVDDEITVCKSIRQAIEREDYEVDTALSAEEALQKEGACPYDLIITDLMMPGISGLDLLQQLKQNRPQVTVIMVTGYPTIRTAVESVKLGAFDYLPKPFTPADLRSLVARAFKKAETEKEKEAEATEARIPTGYYYMLGHTWLNVEEENKAAVGVMPEFLKTVGIITHLELPQVSALISQGEVCGKVTDRDQFTHRIWSPASGRVIEVNSALLEDYSLLRRAPFTSGFLFRIDPTQLEEDLKGLIRAT